MTKTIKPLLVPKVMPPEGAALSQEEWLVMSEEFLKTLALIEIICPETKENCQKLREFAFTKVKE